MDSFFLGWWAFFWFLAYGLGYWSGRDANQRPFTISETATPMLYGWAFVGVFSWVMPLGG